MPKITEKLPENYQKIVPPGGFCETRLWGGCLPSVILPAMPLGLIWPTLQAIPGAYSALFFNEFAQEWESSGRKSAGRPGLVPHQIPHTTSNFYVCCYRRSPLGTQSDIMGNCPKVICHRLEKKTSDRLLANTPSKELG